MRALRLISNLINCDGREIRAQLFRTPTLLHMADWGNPGGLLSMLWGYSLLWRNFIRASTLSRSTLTSAVSPGRIERVSRLFSKAA